VYSTNECKKNVKLHFFYNDNDPDNVQVTSSYHPEPWEGEEGLKQADCFSYSASGTFRTDNL